MSLQSERRTLIYRDFSIISIVFSVVVSVLVFSNKVYSEEENKKSSGFSVNLMAEARDFVLNSKKIPQFEDKEQFEPIIDLKFLRYGVGSQKISEHNSNSWSTEDYRIMYIVFKVEEYVGKRIPLHVSIYKIWNGSDYENFAMIYQNVDSEKSKRVGRTAVLIDKKWYINRNLYNSNDRDTDINPHEVNFNKKEDPAPLRVRFKFNSTEGVKEVVVEINKDPSLSTEQNPSAVAALIRAVFYSSKPLCFALAISFFFIVSLLSYFFFPRATPMSNFTRPFLS